MFNLKGIREAVFSQLDWAPAQDSVAKARVNQFIDRAYMQLVQDAPFLFFEDELRFAVHEDKVPELATDLLTTTTDAWVLETQLAVGTTDALVWEEDRPWDGRTLLVQIEDSPEQWVMVRIREVWQEGDKIRVSLEKPWRNVTDTDLKYRVISDEFVMQDDVVEVKSVSLFEDNTGYVRPIEIIGQSAAEYGTFPHNNHNQVGGVPATLYRREYQSLQAPTFAPAAADVDGAWAGPEPTGKFDYLFTYVWGKQEVWSHSPGPTTQTALTPDEDRYEPYWESPPSAATASVDNSTGTATNRPIQMSLPDVDFMHGFGDASTPRYNRSGYRKRIYRRRRSASASRSIESPDTYFLLDEVDGNVTAYTDDGSVTPDYNRPLREVHGYRTFRLHPKPTRRFTMVARVIRRPRTLIDEADTPKIVRDGIEALISRATAFTYMHQGNASMAQFWLNQYEGALHDLKKRYGDERPSNRPMKRNYASARRWYRRRRDSAGLVKNT